MYMFAISDCAAILSKQPGFARTIEIELEFHRGD